jgi:hypothetical protein
VDVEAEQGDDDLLALDEALQRLCAEEPTAAEVVKLRYFAGLSRHWAYAKAWLYRPMSGRDATDA